MIFLHFLSCFYRCAPIVQIQRWSSPKPSSSSSFSATNTWWIFRMYMNVLCFESSPNKTKHTVNLYPFVIWSVLNLLAFSIRSCHASCRSYRLPPRRDEVHRLDKSSQDWVVNHRGLSLDVIGNPGNWFFSIILEKPPGFLEKLRRAQTGKYWKMFALSLSLSFFF